jgi:hypothetical protein
VNFALPDWLPDGKECVVRYKEHAKPPVFSHNELLITITLYSETIKTALWWVNDRLLFICGLNYISADPDQAAGEPRRDG